MIGVVVLTDEMRDHARRAALALGPWTHEQRDFVAGVFATAKAVKVTETSTADDMQVAA